MKNINNKKYLDLYGDIFNVIKLNEPPTFEIISSYFKDNSDIQKEFSYKGKSVIAKRKIVIHHNRIKSKYLHVLIEFKKHGDTILYQHYREDNKGNFNFIGYKYNLQ